jgi:ankyrin repeat protein
MIFVFIWLQYGYTALSHACAGGHTGTAVLLLDRGAAIDHEDHDQSTPLILACAAGHTKTAAMLLDRGADLHHEAKHGELPLLSLLISTAIS